KMFSSCDYVFMNENESNAIFDETAHPLHAAPHQIICITRGKAGANIYTNKSTISLPGLEVNEIDPTGAGDTFAGTMLACLARGLEAQESAELAVKRSSLVVSKAGPSALFFRS